MKSPAPEAQAKRALESLKDFQRRTVDYVFDRLYLAKDSSRRMLISDEVGLGKTMVARGVIARAMVHLWKRVDRLDIVYVCSNGDIARQNVNRLGAEALSASSVRSATRLTLLAREIPRLGDVNFIALTPATSFDLGRDLGAASERALLYWLLKGAWQFRDQAGPYNVLRGYADGDRFRSMVRETRPDDVTIDVVGSKLRAHLDQAPQLRDEFAELCSLFARDRKHIPDDERRRRREFVGAVRAKLARTCVDALNPDLVILDEFQRFRHLMDDQDDASVLARELFNYTDEHGEAKVLLLSATPYKMLTLSSEMDGEDHYQDFLRTLKFLYRDSEEFKRAERAVTDFRLAMLRLRNGGQLVDLLRAKMTLEAELRRVIVRTERLAATPDRSGMLTERRVQVSLTPSDLHAYVGAQEVAATLGERDVMEYWKSAPFLLNFLEGYKLREKLKAGLDDEQVSRKIAATLKRNPDLLLQTSAVRELREIAMANPRLRALSDEVVAFGEWRALWLPANLSYYQAAGPFAELRAHGFSKRLIFSAWKMVPRSVATLLSYAADVATVERLEAVSKKESSSASRWPTPVLRFSADPGGRLTGMPLLLLLYPSPTLAAFDPLEFAFAALKDGADLPALEMTIDAAQSALRSQLEGILPADRDKGAVDERWYWAAPLLLDLQRDPSQTKSWLEQLELAAVWQGVSGDEQDGGESRWDAHVAEFRRAAKRGFSLGRPPADLLRVLAEAAVSSPAVCALRALQRQVEKRTGDEGLAVSNAAAAIGWSFRNLLNLPEAVAIVRGVVNVEPHWRAVLHYCALGELQAMLDEYLHVLREYLGLLEKSPAQIADEMAATVQGALGVRVSAIGADDIRLKDDGDGIAMDTVRLRTRFAMAFADARPEDTGTDVPIEGEVTRAEKVRDAFNSPFWPFVLVSTSVGQEGLDFHPYCHTIVHWNLPTNPVDLEQREGRIHRFKGLAVRKNVARAQGQRALTSPGADPWSTAFDLALKARPSNSTDLVPFWVYPVEGGAQIERCVPTLPLSRDVIRFADLRRTLVVYRMVFGQPRQDDLIEYLTSRFAEGELDVICSKLRVDLSPPASSAPS